RTLARDCSGARRLRKRATPTRIGDEGSRMLTLWTNRLIASSHGGKLRNQRVVRASHEGIRTREVEPWDLPQPRSLCLSTIFGFTRRTHTFPRCSVATRSAPIPRVRPPSRVPERAYSPIHL